MGNGHAPGIETGAGAAAAGGMAATDGLASDLRTAVFFAAAGLRGRAALPVCLRACLPAFFPAALPAFLAAGFIGLAPFFVAAAFLRAGLAFAPIFLFMAPACFFADFRFAG